MANFDRELKKDYVYRCILEKINSGQVTDGKFPSEPEFCKEFEVSRVTLRAALRRLEKEGLITRSHYYGTRITRDKPKKLLIVCSDFTQGHCDRKMRELTYLEAACREQNLRYDTLGLHLLQDPAKLSETYCGIIFFGAAISGDEPFIQVIRASGLPAVYCREDEVNTITDYFPSVGVNMKKAWLLGFDYLVSLGFRRIMTLISDDQRSGQRIGITKADFSGLLQQRGLTEAAEMVCNIPDFYDGEYIRNMVKTKEPEAIFCYSDYIAILLYQHLRLLGKRIPQDVVVLGFDCGSLLVTPTLSSVSLVSPLFGKTVLSLLKEIASGEISGPPPQLELPVNLHLGDSTAKINLENLIKNDITK
ncbi:MAG: GntR family transcriptional regulator [Lentisphaeria bacterium]|nr:GntR family transcriptional regulator [Lentisphaeria bacterium]